MLRGHTQEQEAIEGEQSILTKRRFDTIGLVLSMVGFTTLVYGITQAGSRGWSDSTVMTSLILGALVLVTFTVVELRVSDPVIDVRLFANYTFSISNILTWVTVGGIFGALFLLPFFVHPLTGVAATCAAIAKTDGSALRTCVAQHVTVMGINDTFMLVMISCAICALLALLLGRDPTIEAAKRTCTQEDEVKIEQPVIVSK